MKRMVRMTVALVFTFAIITALMILETISRKVGINFAMCGLFVFIYISTYNLIYYKHGKIKFK